MKKFNLIIQFIFRIFLYFILSFIWVKYLLNNFFISFCISVGIALFIEIITRLINQKNNKNKLLKNTEKINAENSFLSLATSNNYLIFFNNLAQKKYITELKNNFIKIIHDDYFVILYPLLKFSEITAEDVNSILKTIEIKNVKKIVIPCGEISKPARDFIKNIDTEIILLDKYNSYEKLYKYYNFFPDITKKYKENSKETFNEILAISFNKQKTKNYLFSALIILFSSIFVKLNIYYCLISSILVIFAIISFFSPFNKKKSNNVEL